MDLASKEMCGILLLSLQSLRRNQLTDIFLQFSARVKLLSRRHLLRWSGQQTGLSRQKALGEACNLLTTRAKKFDYQEC